MSRLTVIATSWAAASSAIVQPVFAQASPDTAESSAAGESSDSLEAVVVTGSRIARSGYEAPNPLTVLGEGDINTAARANIADYVNEIPSVVGSATPANSNTNISAGTSGVSTISLRALGSNRTLVLLDGQRSVGSLLDGSVDVSTFPQGLIRSIEIVTGGASAAYGSDAVSGVVNFILDKKFRGLKATVEGGSTAYDDDGSRRVSLTGGWAFAGDRGHLLLNGEVSQRDGIYGVPRDWNDNGWYIINNPAYSATNGQPERLLVSGAGLSNATPGGIITNTALRGTYFGVGGAVNHLAYGATLDPWMVGGDWRMVQVNDRQALHADEDRTGTFGRLSYRLNDAVEVYGQASWNRSDSLGWAGVQFNQGNVVIRSDNAFIPASVRQQLADLRITQFNLGTTNADLPVRKTDSERSVQRYVVGANGAFDVFGDTWKWDGYYQKGITATTEMARDVTNNARLALAQDAVVDPRTGAIVCRSTLTDLTNGCVPFNRLGIGVNSQAALDYVLGNPFRDQRFTQDVVAVSLTADAFRNWLGTVSVALGLEHRREAVSGSVEDQYRAGWFVGNYLPTFGHYDVTEGYVEAVLPLMTGLDFNGAVRATDYSLSGYVTTWKAGLAYSPIADAKFRVTRSRDIRAPNLQELFQAGASRTNNLIDPFNNNTSVQFTEITTGNLGLQPEIADTWGVGVVLQPSFLPRFGMSIDYYDIEINDAIGAVTAQVIVDRCFQGVQDYCAAIDRGTSADGAPIITRVRVSPFNFAVQRARGIDLEMSYSLGSVTWRAMGTRYLENYVNNGIDVPRDSAGQNTLNGPPDWLYRLSMSYQRAPWTVTLTGRGLSSGVYDNSFIECTSTCPESTVANRTINDNHIAGAFYVDAAFAYSLERDNGHTEAFFNITNLANRDPAIVASGPGGSAYGNPSTNQTLYDFLGRTYRVGVRFTWE